MATAVGETDLVTFGIGMMAGLVRAGWTTLDERRLSDVHHAFLAAYKVVEEELGEKAFSFNLIINHVYGTSRTIDAMFSSLLGSGYATKDAPGTIYRFQLGTDYAARELERVPGGVEVYDKAAKAFIEYLSTHYAAN